MPTSTVSLEKAQATLPNLISAATRGEEVIIALDGVPAGRLVAVLSPADVETPGQRLARGSGAWKGQSKFPSWEEWKRMDAENEADFEEVINKRDP